MNHLGTGLAIGLQQKVFNSAPAPTLPRRITSPGNPRIVSTSNYRSTSST